MTRTYKIVDVFAGPGGLAEGFSSVVDGAGHRPFQIALSVEMEPSAFATLRLRSFFRQFDQVPQAYYDYLSKRISKEEMIKLHPSEWAAAVSETRMLTLGTEAASAEINPILDSLREAGSPTILIGGPPCQAYSLVGRARNKGNKNYDASADKRHFLYQEYIRIIERLRPVAFVMENVKGILSSQVDGTGIFGRIISDLRDAGGFSDSYTLLPLAKRQDGIGESFVLRSEDYGVPQMRHRVILVGVRTEYLASLTLSSSPTPQLELEQATANVASVLEAMPALRAGLSKAEDTPEAWREAILKSYDTAASACRRSQSGLEDVAKALDAYRADLKKSKVTWARSCTTVTPVQNAKLSAWLSDERLKYLPNHETRGHMQADLARYAFASTFALLLGRSPKANEYPDDLAPIHANWKSGKFVDRFRVQRWDAPSSTITSHISKDGHYFIHPDPTQCRSLTVREAARLQTFPDNYVFEGNRTQQFVQVGNAVPPLLAYKIANYISIILDN